MRRYVPFLMLSLALPLACATPDQARTQPTAQTLVVPAELNEAGFQRWLDGFVTALRPLEKASALASWTATGSGKREDYEASEAAELKLTQLYSDKASFEYLKKLRASGAITDPLLQRQLERLYIGFLGNQFDPALQEQLIRMGSAIEEKFNTYRADVDGKRLSDNDVEAILKSSNDSAERKRVWEASKGIGSAVAADVIALVKVRNQVARSLGYENYYVMSLEQGEQDEKSLFALLDDMAQRTDAPFQDIMRDLKKNMATRYKIDESSIRPWHFEDRFFQETPSVGSVNLDPIYASQDVVELTARFYDSIGLDVRKVIARSDLLGREGKYQHAYCTDIDREGDVRIMSSVQPNRYWMDTELHEFGHAVYSLGHAGSQDLPFLLRDSAHTFTTEGVANLMGRLAGNPEWLKRFAGVDAATADKLAPQLRKLDRMGALVFARWCLVMANFERELYRNPDQDLNGLWWKLVARYQLVTPPEGRNAPDWASKIHLVSSPVYYHNYLLGDLYAAQLHDAIVKNLYPGVDPYTVVYAGNPKVGAFLQEKVFAPGAKWRWDRFVVESTGEPLSPRAYAAAYMAP